MKEQVAILGQMQKFTVVDDLYVLYYLVCLAGKEIEKLRRKAESKMILICSVFNGHFNFS